MAEKSREFDLNRPDNVAWRVALLFPPQGSWSEQDYLSLDGGRLVEFSGGCIEVHDMPTMAHQRIVRFLFQLIAHNVSQNSVGEVFFAPLPVHLWNQKFREPDLVYVARDRKQYGQYPDGADLVVEVVSEGAESRIRDMKTKVDEYAQAKISEYWVVDPENQEVLVYQNPIDGKYKSIQKYGREQAFVSSVLSTLNVAVAPIFDANH